tara:strand:- start:365 stop:1279 length:915 start_codon:yes stop_codon:yes gene_type:complete
MRNALLIPLAAGTFSALLHVTVIFGIFSLAPIAATGLSLGFMSGAVAASFAAIIIAIVSTGSGSFSIFVLTSALPTLVAVFFSLQNRRDQAGNVEWYPLGRILSWLTALSMVFFITAFFSQMGNERGLEGAVERFVISIFGQLPADAPPELNDFFALVFKILPASIAASGILLVVLNCALAQRWLIAKGKNIRPKPDYSGVETMIWPLATAVIGGILWFTGGNLGYLGLNVLLISAIPFFFIGLAVLHSISAAWPGRPFILAAAYILMFVLRWPVLLMATVGALEPWLKIREKANAQHSNKGDE